MTVEEEEEEDKERYDVSELLSPHNRVVIVVLLASPSNASKIFQLQHLINKCLIQLHDVFDLRWHCLSLLAKTMLAMEILPSNSTLLTSVKSVPSTTTKS